MSVKEKSIGWLRGILTTGFVSGGNLLVEKNLIGGKNVLYFLIIFNEMADVSKRKKL